MKDNKKIIKIIKVIAIIIFAIIIIYFVHRLFKHSLIVKRIMRIKLKKPDIHKFRYIMSHHKYLVAVLFEVIFALKPLVFFVPSSLVCIFAGEYFGPLVGFLLNMVGIFLSSTTGFYFARILGQSFVNKILRGKSLKLDNNIEQKGFKLMFTMRVSMVFPHDALSYAAGLSKIKYKDFILATCLGMIPE
ncbi:MAG: TVP38/TMEM64 family protein, partial [Bacillota bacterium]|nr:TVP38/TMEM64 family protein [Bacillota bacterium]